jgi:hypothetical protein
MSNSSQFFTVVFEIKDGHHDEWWSIIEPMFLTDDAPITVTCVTRGDLAERVEQLENEAGVQENG